MAEMETPVVKKRGCGYQLAKLLAQLIIAALVFWIGYIAFSVDNIMRPAPSAVCCATPADRGLDYERVTLSSTEGVTLAGWYIPSQNTAAVILLHGYNANRMDMLNHAEFLAQHGYGVLMYDLRGHGESGGQMRAFGWPDVNDATAALDWLQNRPDVNSGRIGILGFSVGGQIALRAAAQTDRLKAVVADGASDASPQDLPPPRSVQEWFSNQSDTVAYRALEWRTSLSAPPGVVRVIGNIAPRPTLLIAAGLDDSERRLAQRYCESAQAPKAVWEIPGVRHGGGLVAQPEQYKDKVVTFFDQSLLKDDSRSR